MGFAFLSLRQVIQINPEPKAGGHLVTSGIYRILRHPIYTAIVMVLLGLWLREPTLVLAIVTAAVIVFLLVKTRYEERLLTARYPDYSQYRHRTLGVILGL